MNEAEYWEVGLRSAASQRATAAEYHRVSLEYMNDYVRAAREAGVSAVQIAVWIGTTRQRVYEILRES